MINKTIFSIILLFLMILSFDLRGDSTLKAGVILGDGYGLSLNYSPEYRFSVETNIKSYKFLKKVERGENSLDWGYFVDIGILFKQKLSETPDFYISTGVLYYRDYKNSWESGVEIPIRFGTVFAELPIDLYVDLVSLYNFEKKDLNFDLKVGIRWSFGEKKAIKIPDYCQFNNENSVKLEKTDKKNKKNKKVVEKNEDITKKEINDSKKIVETPKQKTTKRKVKRKVLKKNLLSSENTTEIKTNSNQASSQEEVLKKSDTSEKKDSNSLKKESEHAKNIVHDPLKVKLSKDKKNIELNKVENSKSSNLTDSKTSTNEEEWIEVEVEIDESELDEKDKNNPKGVDVIW